MPVLINRKGVSAVLHMTANESFTIAGDSSTSNIASPGETLTGATITQVWFGSSSGDSAYWTIKRGANTVAVLDSTGYIDFAGNGVALNKDTGATLVANLVNSTTGFLMVELQKIPTSGS